MTAVSVEPFGSVDGVAVERYVLTGGGITLAVITYGGIVQQLLVPDASGKLDNVTLGFATVDDYVAHNGGPYFGAITGRFANRIANAEFSLDGKRYPLAANIPPVSLHGGTRGFNTFVWDAEQVTGNYGVGVRLNRVSPDGEEGYPGALDVSVTYWLDDAGLVRIAYEATTDAPTVLNLTNHAYFNLAGEGNGTILDHHLRLFCSHMTPTDEVSIPTGELSPVVGTPFDFLQSTRIGDRIDADDEQIRIGNGYDHNWVVDHAPGAESDLAPVADLYDPASGRTLNIETTEPAVQFYAGNYLDSTLVGTGGKPYPYRGGLALETQHFPDSPNQPDFPTTVLRPGERFTSMTTWSFGTRQN